MSTRVWKLAALVLSFAVVPSIARAQAIQSVCKDGTKSTTAGKGTCSGHNGVDEAATKAFLASGKTVVCTDGTMSAGGRGACSGHGGIGKKTAAAEKKEAKAEKKEAKAEVKAEKKEAKAEAKAAKAAATEAKKDTKSDKKATKPLKKDAKAPA